MEVPQYKDMCLVELRELAKIKGIIGYSTKKKKTLIELLEKLG